MRRSCYGGCSLVQSELVTSSTVRNRKRWSLWDMVLAYLSFLMLSRDLANGDRRGHINDSAMVSEAIDLSCVGLLTKPSPIK